MMFSLILILIINFFDERLRRNENYPAKKEFNPL